MNDKPVALLSVTDKTGLIPFAKSLVALGYEIFSTGGTARTLEESGVAVTYVSAYTDFPEIMGGRVKTLHPKIHAGIMYDRNNPDHVREAKECQARSIDLVAVNLYQFVQRAVSEDLALKEAIEFIDIGGPTMIRAAAKNYQHVHAVIDPKDYDAVIADLKNKDSREAVREKLAMKVFDQLARYNESIGNYFHLKHAEAEESMLRYGENPHQKAFVKSKDINSPSGFAAFEQLQGKQLSYNNYLDCDAAWKIVRDFETQAVSIIKHNNPCGVATGGSSQFEIYKNALSCDPKSAFGGIVACNREITAELASELKSIFLECVLAPSFDPKAVEILSDKKNLRLLKMSEENEIADFEVKSINGALLYQSQDDQLVNKAETRCVTRKTLNDAQTQDLMFAMTIAKHVKSNAIVFARNGQTIGIGAGQMSRIDACELAVKKAEDAGLEIEGCVMASDAFFPFRDTVDFAAQHNVSAIVQPGGSIKDQDSINAADEQNIAMLFTGMRHFRH